MVQIDLFKIICISLEYLIPYKCKLFVLRIVSLNYNCLLKIIIIISLKASVSKQMIKIKQK